MGEFKHFSLGEMSVAPRRYYRALGGKIQNLKSSKETSPLLQEGMSPLPNSTLVNCFNISAYPEKMITSEHLNVFMSKSHIMYILLKILRKTNQHVKNYDKYYIDSIFSFNSY